MIFYRIKITVLFVAIFAQGNVQGQDLLPVLYDTTLANHQVSIVGNVFQHSTGLNNNFSRKFIFGGEINDELSQKTFGNQNDYNRVGFAVHAGAEYRASHKIFDSKPNWSWMINVANEMHFSGEYSDDFFGLMFVGNTPFFGNNASLANVSGRFDHFLSIGGGIHDRKTKSFLTLNMILPQQFFQMNINRGGMTFSEIGDQVDLRIEGEAMIANSHAYFKGLGAALNFGFNIPFNTSDAFNGIINIIGRNIGAYQVHNADFITVDAEQSFSGFALNDLLNNDGLSSFKDSLNISETSRSGFKVLPGFLQVGKIVTTNSTKVLQSFFGVRMYTNSVYRPLVYAGIHYQPLERFSFGAQGSFGGYGNFRLGFYANYNTEKILIGLGTEDLLGAISGNQYGHSAIIRLAWKI